MALIKWKPMLRAWRAFACALLALYGAAAASANAQQRPVSADVASAQENGSSSPVLDKEELKLFVDGVVKTAMEDHRIAGAVVAVVSRDDILLLEGYGLANAETREAVDPSVHLFRVASITKLFTATAIMQLVEDGRVDLDADIRTYLGDLEFDDRLGPVTVSHLLTHTPGFEDRLFGYFGNNARLEEKPRSEQFAALAPRQVRAPGVLTSYSNYGFALLGEIIARVSGKPYARYLEDEIFTPLGMTRSTTSIRSTPVGEGGSKVETLRAAEAKSHAWRNGWYAPQSFLDTLDLIESEGSLSTTAEDMTRFMRAHLNDGAFNGAAILEPQTAQRMYEPLFSHLPGINGNAHGFWILEVEGHTTLDHGGSINDFLSNFVLVPELGIGVFVSTNTQSGGRLNRLPERIIKAFFPKAEDSQLQTDQQPEASLSGLAGEYIGARRIQSRLGKIASLTEALTIAPGKDGDLIVSGDFGSDRYVPIGGNRFQALRNGEIMGFELTEKGEARYVFFSNSGHNGYERLTFANHALTLFLPGLLAVVAAVSVLAGYGVRLAGFSPKYAPAADRIERLLVLATAIACLVLVVQIVLTLSELTSNINMMYEEFPTPGFVVLKFLGYAFVFIAIPTAMLSPRAILSGRRSLIGKARYLAYGVVMLVFVWSLFNWKLLIF